MASTPPLNIAIPHSEPYWPTDTADVVSSSSPLRTISFLIWEINKLTFFFPVHEATLCTPKPPPHLPNFQRSPLPLRPDRLQESPTTNPPNWLPKRVPPIHRPKVPRALLRPSHRSSRYFPPWKCLSLVSSHSWRIVLSIPVVLGVKSCSSVLPK